MRVVGIGPDAIAVGKSEESRGMSGVEVTNSVWKDRENAWEAADICGLSSGDAGGESGSSAVVGVEDFRGR
jgi:hypothetical protein